MSNKHIVKNLMSETESIFGRIKNKIDPRTRSAIITKLGKTTYLSSIKIWNNKLKGLEKNMTSIKEIKRPQKEALQKAEEEQRLRKKAEKQEEKRRQILESIRQQEIRNEINEKKNIIRNNRVNKRNQNNWKIKN